MSITQLTAARTTKAAPTVEMKPDLIQRVRQLAEYVSGMIELFDEIEPNISIVKNIADELKELESKTITVVNQFTQQIYLKEDEADEIIVLLNQEVQRVEDHIDDLLGLAENFGQIADEIQSLLQLRDRVDDMGNTLDSLIGATKVIPIQAGSSVPVVDRKSDSVYLSIQSVTGTGANKVYRTVFEDHTGAKHYFKTASNMVEYDGESSILFGGLSNVDAVISKIDDILHKKCYIKTYYAAAKASYEGTVAPFTQTVSVPGILETDEPLAGYILDANNTELALQQEKASGNISRIVTSNNAITIYCNKKKPEVAVNIRLLVFRTD